MADTARKELFIFTCLYRYFNGIQRSINWKITPAPQEEELSADVIRGKNMERGRQKEGDVKERKQKKREEKDKR
jgi:hypothetical protein